MSVCESLIAPLGGAVRIYRLEIPTAEPNLCPAESGYKLKLIPNSNTAHNGTVLKLESLDLVTCITVAS